MGTLALRLWRGWNDQKSETGEMKHVMSSVPKYIKIGIV